VAFKGRDPVKTKIVIDNKTIEQVKSFNYLGNMISYEREPDIEKKINHYLKITGILNNVYRPQKSPQENKNKSTQHTGRPSQCCYMAAKLGLLQRGAAAECQQQRWSTEENSRIHWDRLQNKYTNCKGVKNNSNFGQITGIQEKLDTTCKQNASQ
jgi:hypothetical protein